MCVLLTLLFIFVTMLKLFSIKSHAKVQYIPCKCTKHYFSNRSVKMYTFESSMYSTPFLLLLVVCRYFIDWCSPSTVGYSGMPHMWVGWLYYVYLYNQINNLKSIIVSNVWYFNAWSVILTFHQTVYHITTSGYETSKSVPQQPWYS